MLLIGSSLRKYMDGHHFLDGKLRGHPILNGGRMVSAALDGKWNEWPSPVNEINIEMNSHISF